MYFIGVYVPESHIETVKKAMFKAGAGRIGLYDSCAWVTKGTGQFRPLPGSHPERGTQMAIEKVVEYKVELVCEKEYLNAVIDALKKSHPYEEPAYHVLKMEAI
ncbi:MAG: NGG1p interacting factor NIF3 [Candidatus Marinimicrobia bacterium]|nr:NGG1p interacting factor NIF3 [Candidatus Neomarinimicrobiota bacterium]